MISNYPLWAPLMPYMAFTASSPVIPNLYWDVFSNEERVKEICCHIKKLIEYGELQTAEINKLEEATDLLMETFEKFQETGFDDYYAEQVATWIANNLAYVFNSVASQVFFGLTADGRFCAYVPTSWNQITFDTGAVYGTEQYGRLILRYNSDGRGVIDNTAPDYAEIGA